VSECNLTLSPYQIIRMRHHHEHPLAGVMELRPDHWSTTLKSHLEISRITHWHESIILNQSRMIYHTYTHIHVTYQLYINHLFHVPSESIPIHYSQTIDVEFISCQYHATLITNHLIRFTCQDHTFTSIPFTITDHNMHFISQASCNI